MKAETEQNARGQILQPQKSGCSVLKETGCLYPKILSKWMKIKENAWILSTIHKNHECSAVFPFDTE